MPVSHFAEGSLAHLLQNLYIFTIIPERAPFLLRPLVRSIFGSVIAKLIQPQLEAAKKMVRSRFTSYHFYAYAVSPRSRITWRKPQLSGLRVGMYLLRPIL